jgi:hypothetical protein
VGRSAQCREVDYSEVATDRHVEVCGEVGRPYTRAAEGDQLGFRLRRHIGENVGSGEHLESTEAVPVTSSRVPPAQASRSPAPASEVRRGRITR